MTKFLTFISFILGVLGLIFLLTGGNGQGDSDVANLPTMILGVGIIAAGCLVGILARVAQAEAHHTDYEPGVLPESDTE